MMRLLFLIPFIVIFSCSQIERRTQFDSLIDYQEWVNSNESGYSLTKESENLRFNLTFHPLITNSVNSHLDTLESNILKFQFIVSPRNGEDVLHFGLEENEQYNDRVKFLEYFLKECFEATLNNDTLKPSFIHYENFRGIKNQLLVHVHFTLTQKLQQTFQVHFHDKIYSSGVYKYDFSPILINTPLVINTIKND